MEHAKSAYLRCLDAVGRNPSSHSVGQLLRRSSWLADRGHELSESPKRNVAPVPPPTRRQKLRRAVHQPVRFRRIVMRVASPASPSRPATPAASFSSPAASTALAAKREAAAAHLEAARWWYSLERGRERGESIPGDGRCVRCRASAPAHRLAACSACLESAAELFGRRGWDLAHVEAAHGRHVDAWEAKRAAVVVCFRCGQPDESGGLRCEHCAREAAGAWWG